MKVLLVAPPRLLWPFMNEQDNFLLPQSLPCLAAVLREGGIDVKVVDCMPDKVGWKSLARLIDEFRPNVVAAGENHALYASEAIKFIELAKSIDRDVYTILGGAHFTNIDKMYLERHPIDYIVRGEGEIAFLNLVQALDGGGHKDAEKVLGISYLRDGEMVYTAPQPLVEDLDSLPIPAYDLMSMRKYGKAKYLFSPGGTTIHHGRGCTGRCKFCVWWTQMADRKRSCEGETLKSRWRTKSVERTLEEMEILYKEYDKHCLVFVDPTFNINSDWDDRFAEALIKKNWDLNWFAFMRADLILRDEKRGIFEKMVRSGLIHLCIGIERAADEDLQNWNKKFYSNSESVEVFDLLKRKYPQVFRQATFIVGTRDETKQTMHRQLEFAKLLDADYPAFHPVTPFPGTDLYLEAKEKGWIEIDDFDQYDLMTPVMSSKYMSREEIEAEMVELNKEFVGPRWLLKGLLSSSPYRRNMYIWWLSVMVRVFADSTRRLLNPFNMKQYTGLVKPDWYDD
jgi:anaerobic magnesium-protoporphyrin IX monomethyl ester cyclase